LDAAISASQRGVGDAGISVGASKTPKSPLASTTELTKKKLAAIVLSEAEPSGGFDEEQKIAWIYFNRNFLYGEAKALNASSAYKKQGLWYRIWSVSLGIRGHENDQVVIPQGKNKKPYQGTISDYIRTPYLKSQLKTRVPDALKAVQNTFSNPGLNPYREPDFWIGQGSLDDINRNTGKWILARQYYWLQKKGEVKSRLVEAVGPKMKTFIFDEVTIEKFFKKDPKKLQKSVPKVP